MTACPTDRPGRVRHWLRLAAVAALSAGFGTLTVPAFGQDASAPIDAPLRLIPPGSDSGNVVPSPSAAPPAANTAPGTDEPQAITVQPLGAPNPDETGVLSAQDGAFADDLWLGSSLREVTPFLEALPAPMTSPAQKALAVRLLSSGGSLPTAEAGDAASLRPFGAIRVEKLAALGAVDAAETLAARIPDALSDEPAAHALVRAELDRGNGNCADWQPLIAAFTTDFWRRLDILCRVRQGDADSAQVALDMLREGGPIDPAFQTAIERQIGLSDTVTTAGSAFDAVTLAALRQAKTALPAEAAVKAAAQEALAIARDPDADPLTRASAGEKAAAALLMGTRELLGLYAALPASTEDSEKTNDDSVRARGGAIAAMAGAMNAKRRADLSIRAARLVPASWRATPVGGAAASLLTGTSPMDAYSGLAPWAVTLYGALGNTPQTRLWYDWLATTPAARADALQLWPLALLTDATPEGGIGLNVVSWLDAESRHQPSSRTVLLVPALQALGISMPANMADRIAAQAALVTAPDVVNRLSSAARDGRIGETALLALDLLGDGGPASASPGVLARVADALAANGMERAARAIVREAVAARIE